MDGTLTIDNDWNVRTGTECYRRRKPDLHAIDLVKGAVEKDWTVIIRTGRKEEHRALTVEWLAANQVPYHFLFMNKPLCTYRIDDVNITKQAFRNVLLEKSVEKTEKENPSD